MGELLRLDGVRVSFGRKRALDGVSLSFGGGVLVIAGPNGAGKTTLLNVISGLIVPEEGGCRVLGVRCEDVPRVGGGPPYVRESLPPSRVRVADFVESVQAFRGVDVDAVRSNLSFLGLDPREFWGRRLGSLSAGERVKVYVSLALAIRSSLYLLDEPSSNLDMNSRGRLRNLIANYLDGGASFVVTTHTYEYLDDLATDVLFLKGGRVAYLGSVEGSRDLCIAWFERGARDSVLRVLTDAGVEVVHVSSSSVVFRCGEDGFSILSGVGGVRRVEVGGLKALYATIFGGEGV